MFVTADGQAAEAHRLDLLTHALKKLEERVPGRMLRTWILIRRGTTSWRQRAAELRVTPGAIRHHLKTVDKAIEKWFNDESTTAC